MFNHCSAKQLKDFLKEFKEHHTIKNSSKMKKADLVETMEKIHSAINPLDGSGWGKAAGYVHKLEAEENNQTKTWKGRRIDGPGIVFNKIQGQGPSQYMIRHYGPNAPQVNIAHAVNDEEQNIDYDKMPRRKTKGNKKKTNQVIDIPNVDEDIGLGPQRKPNKNLRIFDDDEIVEHNVARPKPKRVRTKEKQPNEEEVFAEETRQEEARRKVIEDKEKRIETIENIQKEIIQLKGRLNNERKKCNEAIDQKKKQRLGRIQKDLDVQKIYRDYTIVRKKLIDSYPDVLAVRKGHELNMDDDNFINDLIKITNQQIKNIKEPEQARKAPEKARNQAPIEFSTDTASKASPIANETRQMREKLRVDNDLYNRALLQIQKEKNKKKKETELDKLKAKHIAFQKTMIRIYPEVVAYIRKNSLDEYDSLQKLGEDYRKFDALLTEVLIRITSPSSSSSSFSSSSSSSSSARPRKG